MRARAAKEAAAAAAAAADSNGDEDEVVKPFSSLSMEKSEATIASDSQLCEEAAAGAPAKNKCSGCLRCRKVWDGACTFPDSCCPAVGCSC